MVKIATYKEVINYLNYLDMGAKKINEIDDFETGTKPIGELLLNYSQSIDFGNGNTYISVIEEGLYNMTYGKRAENVEEGFSKFNVGVERYRKYLAKSWWQFGGGTGKQKPISEVPMVTKIIF